MEMEMIGLYDAQFKHFESLDLLDMIANLTVDSKIGGATFKLAPRNYPITFVKRLLVYGLRREFNDDVAGLKTDKEKVDTVSIRLGELESGIYNEKRAKLPGLTVEEDCKYRTVWKALSKEDREKADELSNDKRREKLIALYDKASVGDSDNAKALRENFDKLYDEATRPKATISLSLAL